jgi:hypothetical protein
MILNEEIKHELLLVIVSLIFIIFATGTGTPPKVPVQPTIVGVN